jgi:hypothetical protein
MGTGNLDLYNARDLVKFGFPLAFTATMLPWAILVYAEHIKVMKQLSDAQDSLT